MSLPRVHGFTLCGLAVVCAVLALPFTPWAERTTQPFWFEATITSTTDGAVQVFYDTGRSYNQEDSYTLGVKAGAEPQLCRFLLPEGNYKELRFDPLNGSGTVRVTDLAIKGLHGELIRKVSPDALRPVQQIASLTVDQGTAKIIITPGGNDPITLIPFDPVLKLHLSKWGWWLRAGLVWAGWLAALLAGGAALRAGGSRTRVVRDRIRGWAAARPRRTIAGLALLGVLVNCYPVVFCGKSFLSPNNGVLMLYDSFPSVPGYHDDSFANTHMSDIGAVMWYHWPLSVVIHHALLEEHEWPLWNRYAFSGTPLIGQGITAFGDPLQIPAILSDGAVWTWDLHYVLSKWLFAFGLGLVVYAGTRHLTSALWVAASAPFIGFFAFRLNHPAFFSVCYAPWILVCWYEVAVAATPRRTALWLGGLVVTNLALMNCGAMKEGDMLLLVLNACGAAVLGLTEASLRIRLKKLAAAIFAGACFVLLTAPIWLTFYWTLKKTATHYDVPRASQLSPTYLIGLFDDLFYGQFTQHEAQFDPSLNFFLLPGVLWAVASLRSLWPRRAFRAVAVAALFALAMVYGLVPGKWIALVPLIGNIVHIDNTFSCVALVLLGVTAGFGFSEMWSETTADTWRWRYVTMLLLLLGMLWGYFSATQNTAFSPFFQGYLPLLLLGAVAVPWLVRAWSASALPRVGLGALLCAIALVCHLRHGQYLGDAFEDHTMRPQLRTDLKAPSPAIGFIQSRSGDPARTVGFGMNLFPGYNQALLLESIFGVDPLRNIHYDQLASALNIERILDIMAATPMEQATENKPAFDFLNVRYYLARDVGVPLTAKLQLMGNFDFAVYESRECWPRAFFTDAVGLYPDAATLARMIRTGDGRPFAAVQSTDLARLPAAVAAMARQAHAASPAVPARDYQLTANTTSFEVRATGPGVIALHESYLRKDFQVTMNGQPAAYFRVNHAFKGIYVPAAGTYRVTFAYWPSDFTLSLWLAGLGLAGLLAGGLVAWRCRQDAMSG